MADFRNTKKIIDLKIKELKLPYFSCIVKKNGDTLFNYSSTGHSDLLTMYSMSKPITAIAFMQLVDKGLVNLEDDVDKYLPGYNNLFDIQTKEKIKTKIKVKHLLSMTSGLDYNLRRPAIKKLDKYADTIKACSSFAEDGLLFEPGTQFLYSLSMDVVAALIEVITKEKFSSYVKKNIFDVLHMDNSTFEYNEKLANSCVDEVTCDENMNLTISGRYYKDFFPTSNYESGGAGLISTTEDYSRFVDSLASRTNKIISDKTVDVISMDYIKGIPYSCLTNKYTTTKADYGYGLGVRVRKHQTKEGIPAGEFGWDGASGSYCLIDRKNNISIVIGMSITGWPSYLKDIHLVIAKEIYKDIFNL